MIIGSHAGYRSQISPTISMPRHSVRCVQSELWKQFFIPSASPIINSAVSGSPRFSIEMTIANEAVILEMNNYFKNEWIPNFPAYMNSESRSFWQNAAGWRLANARTIRTISESLQVPSVTGCNRIFWSDETDAYDPILWSCQEIWIRIAQMPEGRRHS